MGTPYVITTASGGKGGTGKSTTAINLAVGINEHFNCAFIDIDPIKQLTVFNDRRALDQVGKPLTIFDVSTEADINDIVLDDASPYDVVVIDTGGADTAFTRHAIMVSDLTITPLEMASDNETAGLKQFRKVLQEIRGAMNEDFVSYVLLNRVHPNDSSSWREMKQFVDYTEEFKIFKTTLRANKAHKMMLSTGLSAAEQDINPLVTQEVNSLIEEVIKLIKE